MRERAKTLVGEISSDMRDYTVHDITHLDALWGIASEIVGPDYRLSPTEAFVLGGGFLMHDAGMCLAAYPGGMKDIEKSRNWDAVLRRSAADPKNPSKAELETALCAFLRIEHAQKARDLPQAFWESPTGGAPWTLIEDGELRQKFGQFIGEVAASHWWNHSKLAQELNRTIPAPPPFPTNWSLDLLKVACILRVADAAHIDERRAPGFLWALRSRAINGLSNRHWLFQNRLTQPERRNDAIHYSSTSDFKESEAEAWWLAYDTLRMIDGELRQTDVVLADLRSEHYRLAARRVANIETPSIATKEIGVAGWIPIDSNVKISDVAGLIKKLGGKALYGEEPLVPIRELVQNAVDAINLRWAAQPTLDKNLRKIVLHFERSGDKIYVSVMDNGIGMTENIISQNLLDFGRNGWSEDPALDESAIDDAAKFKTIGKYGIGFFSVFMLGEKVEVISRRYDASLDKTLKLSFNGGLATRPLLSYADRGQAFSDAGTKIRICVEEPQPLLAALDVATKGLKGLRLAIGRLFPALEIPLTIRLDSKEELVRGATWATEAPGKLVARCNGMDALPQEIRPDVSNLRSLFDAKKQLVGRLSIVPRWQFSVRSGGKVEGIVMTSGVAVSSLTGIIGLIEGEVTRAARDVAIPSYCDQKVLADWLAEQSYLLEKLNLDVETQLDCASTIRSLGGDTRDLKICETSMGWLSKVELANFIAVRDSVLVVQDAAISNLRRIHKSFSLNDNVISVDTGLRVQTHNQ
jgi:hypothetical protein